MKILVTNDDGINSPGLWASVEAVRPHGEVFVAAPDREQSGVGPSLTLHVPIRATECSPQVEDSGNAVRAFAVEGTPGDSCVLALEKLVGPVELGGVGDQHGVESCQRYIRIGALWGLLCTVICGGSRPLQCRWPR